MEYANARSEEAIVDFVNQNSGTSRTAGGRLSTKAGTIEALDDILAKYVTAGGISDITAATNEVTKAAESLKDSTKDYYLKALTKLTGNPEYAMKEHTRLAGLLKKAGLAPEKIDELQRRSNILAKFLVKEDARSEL